QEIGHVAPAVRDHGAPQRREHVGVHVRGARKEELAESRLGHAWVPVWVMVSSVVTIVTPRRRQSLSRRSAFEASMGLVASVTAKIRVFGRRPRSPSMA